MERNTLQEAGKLSIGDRFYFASDKKKIVFEVLGAGFKVTYNRINAYGYKMLPHDLSTSNLREVIFLRHKTEK